MKPTLSERMRSRKSMATGPSLRPCTRWAVELVGFDDDLVAVAGEAVQAQRVGQYASLLAIQRMPLAATMLIISWATEPSLGHMPCAGLAEMIFV